MRKLRGCCLVLSGASLLALPGTARAQAVRSGEFSVQNFTPAPGPQNFLGVEGVRMDGDWGYSVGVFGNYARNPFVLLSCASATNCGAKSPSSAADLPIIRDMFTLDLLAAVSPIKRLQIGLRVPLSYVSGAGLDLTTGQGAAGGLQKFGVGDPQIEGKVRLLGNAADPVLLGAAVDLSFPVGHAFSNESSAAGQAYYLGNSGPVTAGLRAIFDGHAGPLEVGVNLRGELRQEAQLATTTVGPADFRYGVGLGYHVRPAFRVVAEGFGSTQFSIRNGTNTFEVDGALEIEVLSSRIVIRPGGGAGVIGGVGVPAGRAFLGIGYVHETIAAAKPAPVAAEKCPEAFDQVPPARPLPPGCPEPKPVLPPSDRDHDGIPDDVDKCPDAGGPDIIKNPKNAYYGCPDRDHDGVPDYLDKCPDQPEATDDLWDGSGCPHVHDRDHDGIPDDVDKCPDEPETYNGFEDEDGCPDKGPVLVEISESGIKILERVEFTSGRDKIQGAKSFKVLDAVAGVLKSHAGVTLVEVQGHTDNVGLANANRKLSQQRADAVVTYLVSKGIAAGRLAGKGYGPDKPVADNKKAAGRQANRRVEFIILQSSTKSVQAPPAPAVPPGGAVPPAPAVPPGAAVPPPTPARP